MSRRAANPEWKSVFLKELEAFKFPHVGRAARIAQISRREAYRAREKDPEFARKWHEIKESKVDDLEQLAFESAELDRRVLIFLLQCNRPEIYRETRRLEIEAPAELAGKLRNADSLMDGSVPFLPPASRMRDAEIVEPESNGKNGSNGNGSPEE